MPGLNALLGVGVASVLTNAAPANALKEGSEWGFNFFNQRQDVPLAQDDTAHIASAIAKAGKVTSDATTASAATNRNNATAAPARATVASAAEVATAAQANKTEADLTKATLTKAAPALQACKTAQSECCTHSDCPGNHYCYDAGKALTGKWTGIGACSAALTSCCAGADADPIDQNLAGCPGAALCFAAKTGAPQVTKAQSLVKLAGAVARLGSSPALAEGYRACKSSSSRCCTHSDCKPGHYCYDAGKFHKNQWSWSGLCSSQPADCCKSGKADPVDRRPSGCPAASGCVQDEAWVMLQKMKTCKSAGSSCCEHSDCPNGQYCYDMGYKNNNRSWNFAGACSSKLEECCETAKPLGQRVAHCPLGSHCTENSNWLLFHKLPTPPVPKQLVLGDTIFKGTGVEGPLTSMLYEQPLQKQDSDDVDIVQNAAYETQHEEFSQRYLPHSFGGRKQDKAPEPAAPAEDADREEAYDATWANKA